MIDLVIGEVFAEMGISDDIKFDKLRCFWWMAEAHKNRYLFDKNYPGFRAPSGLWSGH